MGNFSEILSSTEHSTTSRTRNQSGMIAFQDTVAACSLTDLPSLGLMFTWINNQSENHVAKKLDRVLVNDAWMNQFSQSYAKFEPSGISDHTRSRVFLESEPVGRKLPFKFFNFLADHPDFLASVSDTWNQTEPIYHSRSALYIFSKKLKLLKPILRHLNKTKFGDIPRKTKEAFQNLCEKQAQALSDPSSSSFDAVSAATENWNHWASRTTFNVIRRLVLLSGDPFDQFLNTNVASTHEDNAENLTNLIEFCCPAHTAELLVHPIFEAKIRNVLFSMPVNKAPGPDGYPVEFYKVAWPVIRKYFITAVQSFFLYGFLPKGVNATILTPIPKIQGAETMKDFRPISCCIILYKVVSKVLARRLKVLLPELIEPNQCAFVKGRLLLENVLMATELIKNYRKDLIGSRSVLKLDISKAFDTVKWSFIEDTLRAMHIPEQFIHGIHVCLSTGAFSVSVNGELEGFFPSARGLRQGCALSPYLFFIAINVPSLAFNKSAASGSIGYHPTCSQINLTHLSFADDIMVFTNGEPSSLQGIFSVLNEFESWLPKRCLETIERMCSSFLWSGTPNSIGKAKVAWDEVCMPKEEAGLGIRRLVDSSKVLVLSLIWRLITNSSSLWVAWTRTNLLRNRCFWNVKDTQSGSWIWLKLLKLRHQAAMFLKSEIGNGKGTLFWFNNWLNMGKLIDIAGDSSTMLLGISRYATVADATSSGQWNIRRCCTCHLRAMIAAINSVPPPVEDAGGDRVLLKHGDGDYKPWFSSSRTWDQLRVHHNAVEWSKVTWFSEAIPRFSFIAWLAVRNRLSTGDRTRAWGRYRFVGSVASLTNPVTTFSLPARTPIPSGLI
ncbi:PREDICTED: uncharacterized protein LOC106324013 [Brassica oleracea var. oleracea]|uniref:uncharacterized protein LOC106324013 n=1 Tax=Brassica oleracea var. oleracea TaxID=109376 RepID=UPI0006A6AB7C|nr:PREDICTED: uncharacterized protein LOC106324013 [Brassica oleracea var. oleracea]